MSRIAITKHCKGYVNQKFDDTHIASGIKMSFKNGNTISIQFGFGNYCENRFLSMEESRDAEIAIWNKDDKWYQFDCDSVK